MRDAVRTTVSLMLGLALAVGPVAESHGLHDCAHHGSHPSPASPSVEGSGAVSDGAGSHGRHLSGPLEAPPEGPCTCIASCHGVPTATGLAAVPTLPATLVVDTRLPERVPDGRTPRADAYLLPFPNGPPLLPA